MHAWLFLAWSRLSVTFLRVYHLVYIIFIPRYCLLIKILCTVYEYIHIFVCHHHDNIVLWKNCLTYRIFKILQLIWRWSILYYSILALRSYSILLTTTTTKSRPSIDTSISLLQTMVSFIIICNILVHNCVRQWYLIYNLVSYSWCFWVHTQSKYFMLGWKTWCFISDHIIISCQSI